MAGSTKTITKKKALLSKQPFSRTNHNRSITNNRTAIHFSDFNNYFNSFTWSNCEVTSAWNWASQINFQNYFTSLTDPVCPKKIMINLAEHVEFLICLPLPERDFNTVAPILAMSFILLRNQRTGRTRTGLNVSGVIWICAALAALIHWTEERGDWVLHSNHLLPTRVSVAPALVENIFRIKQT